MNSIRLKTQGRIYYLFSNIAAGRLRIAGSGLNTLRLKPYKEAKRFRRVKVDTIAFPGFGKKLRKGIKHHRDGSLIQVDYLACRPPTRDQIRKAEKAKRLKIDRHRYTGRLVDAFWHTNGNLYVLLMDVLERKDEDPNFRMFNLDDGTIRSVDLEEFKAVRKPKKKPRRPAKKKRVTTTMRS